MNPVRRFAHFMPSWHGTKILLKTPTKFDWVVDVTFKSIRTLTLKMLTSIDYGHIFQNRNMIKSGRGVDMGDGWETARNPTRPAILEADDNGILQVLAFILDVDGWWMDEDDEDDQNCF